MGRPPAVLRHAAPGHCRSSPNWPNTHLAGFTRAVRVGAFLHEPSDSHNRFVKISATIITLNEERNIARAIESLRCADEIVVLDSGSTDRTTEIAEKLGARVLESA